MCHYHHQIFALKSKSVRLRLYIVTNDVSRFHTSAEGASGTDNMLASIHANERICTTRGCHALGQLRYILIPTRYFYLARCECRVSRHPRTYNLDTRIIRTTHNKPGDNADDTVTRYRNTLLRIATIPSEFTCTRQVHPTGIQAAG